MARFRRDPRDQSEDVPRTKITRESLREAGRLLAYVRPYWLKFVGAAVALTLSSLLGLAFPYVVGKLVNAGLPGGPADGSLFGRLNVNTIALVMMGVLAFQAAFSYIQAVLFTEVGERSLTDVRRDAYSRLIHLSMTFHVQRRVGELSSRIAADVAQIEDTAVAALPQFLRQTAMLVGSIALIAFTSLRLTAVMLSVFPVLIAVAVVFGRLIRRNSKEAQDRLADGNVVVEETLQGIASVKAFANEGLRGGPAYRQGPRPASWRRCCAAPSTAAASSRSSSSPCSARWCWCCGTASEWCRPIRCYWATWRASCSTRCTPPGRWDRSPISIVRLQRAPGQPRPAGPGELLAEKTEDEMTFLPLPRCGGGAGECEILSPLSPVLGERGWG